ncbi:MAG: hypothetical protein KA154_21565 [Gemmatimonadaceae bacterium]|nr:hypothetical protein [Gemmatimonadaceae bacterium]MCC6431053.1 hypothetical protein [Gemmatimonadaceae bacterium]
MAERRQMFRWLLGGSAGIALGMPVFRANAMPSIAADAWLDDLAPRKQKAFLDIPTFFVDGTPFRRANALLTAFTTSYGMAGSDVGIAFGAHGGALAYLMSADGWKEFGLLDRVANGLRPEDAVKLRAMGAAASAIGVDGVKDIRAKGMRVLACRNTMGRWSRDIAAARQVSAESVLKQLEQALHPGVEPVPAMISAAVLAQSRGLAYVSIA